MFHVWGVISSHQVSRYQSQASFVGVPECARAEQQRHFPGAAPLTALSLT